MNYNIFIFHGTGGNPEENWFPWIKKKLEESGCKVFIPRFPTPEGQSLEAWFKVLEAYRKNINKDTIFIGHSLGGLFLLRLLEWLPTKVKAVFFTGTPIGVRPIKNYDSDNLFGEGFDFEWEKIKKKSDRFTVFHSDNDPYVSLANGEGLAKHLGVKLSLIHNAGHFNAKAGYLKFEELWEELHKIIIMEQ